MTNPQDTYSLELGLMQQGHRLVAGVDEAGRGPLAGPVVAAAVILDDNNPVEGLRDSKRLTAARRDRLFDDIREKALAMIPDAYATTGLCFLSSLIA